MTQNRTDPEVQPVAEGASPDAPPARQDAPRDHAAFAAFAARRPRAFVDSVRHSQRVRFLRRAIIVVCVSVVALIGFVLTFYPLGRLQLGFSIGRVGVQGSKITMERPRLQGWRNDGQPYEIRAQEVAQDTNQPKVFELKEVDARLGAADGTTTHIEAARGVYDSGPDTLALEGPIRIHSARRYDMVLVRAKVDLREGRVTTEEPVVVKLPTADIVADGAIFVETERTVSFDNVRSTFAPDPRADVASEEGEPAPAQPHSAAAEAPGDAAPSQPAKDLRP